MAKSLLDYTFSLSYLSYKTLTRAQPNDACKKNLFYRERVKKSFSYFSHPLKMKYDD